MRSARSGAGPAPAQSAARGAAGPPRNGSGKKLKCTPNGFTVPFLFDDPPSIVENPSIRRLAALDEILEPLVGEGLTAAGRPLLNFSLALNHALRGLNPWGYPGVNLAIHWLTGLHQLGRTDDARAAVRQALRLRPSFSEAQALLTALGCQTDLPQ